MKMTRENYKECIDLYKKISDDDHFNLSKEERKNYKTQEKNRKIRFRYLVSDLSYQAIENYAFRVGVVVKSNELSGSVHEITFKEDL